MNDNGPEMGRRLRVSDILLVSGLVVDVLSLLWNHPLAFLAFMFVGGLFVFLGIAVYLVSLVSVTPSGLSRKPDQSTGEGAGTRT